MSNDKTDRIGARDDEERSLMIGHGDTEGFAGLRVDLKHAEHIGVACEELARVLPEHVPVIVVNGDMCRPRDRGSDAADIGMTIGSR